MFKGRNFLPSLPITKQKHSVSHHINNSTVLSNGYKITFLKVVYNEDNTSAWSYSVEELPGVKDLSHWVLGLPECVTVVDGSPDFYELVAPDPKTGVSGVKWDLNDEFETGEFTVVADGYQDKGIVKVAGKGGTDVGIGEIYGPVCP